MQRAIIGLCLVGLNLLVGCATPKPEIHLPNAGESQARSIVIFFDGTENGPLDRTNISELHRIVLEQRRPDIVTFYIEGVGVGGKLIGAGTAWGIDYRVTAAYTFLLQHYRAGDKVHIFGFSRGAFTARILAAMLYYGGLPADGTTLCNPARGNISSDDCLSQVSRLVYHAYKGEKTSTERINTIDAQLKDIGLQFSRPITVSTLGLWDTVEAFGIVDTLEAIKIKLGLEIVPDPGERNRRYGDQLCNVTRAFHVLSIDDNRADVFTPKLLTLPHLFSNCEAESSSNNAYDLANVNEVWFAGAHSDVGGGYSDCDRKAGCISNVSLKWMIHQLVISGSGVLFEDSQLEAGDLSTTHDAEAGSWLYRRVSRNPLELIQRSTYNSQKAKIHCSVIQRLAQKLPAEYEYQWDKQRDECFVTGETRYEYVGSKNPKGACTDSHLEQAIPRCWFTIVQ